MRYRPTNNRASEFSKAFFRVVAIAIGLATVMGLGWGGRSIFVERAGAAWQVSQPEQEPNETIAQANELTLPAQRTGTVKYGDAAVIEFVYNNGPKDKVEDLFKFTVPTQQTARLDISLTFTNAAADVDIFLYRKDGASTLTPLAVSNGSSTTERITPILTLTEGEYYIGVSAFDDPGNTAQTNYTLSVIPDTQPPPPAIGSLNPVSAIAGGGPFSLTVSGNYFISGQTVLRWNDNPRTTTVINGQQLVAFLSAADIATPGTAFVTVVNPPSLGGPSSPVNFLVLPPGTPEIEVEPNETSAQANLLLAPGKRSGTVATGDIAQVTINLNNGLSDPVEDLFAVNLTQSRRLDLQLKGTNANADLALYLLQEGGLPVQLTALGNSRFKGPNQQITTASALPAGRYLVGVSVVSGASDYTIEARIPGDRLLQVVNSSAAPDSTVTVPLAFFAEGNENLMTFSLGFDTAVLGNPQFVPGADLAAAQLNINQTQVGQGRLGFEIRLPQGQSLPAGLRELGRLNFQIKPNPGVNTTSVDVVDQPVVRTLFDRDNHALIGSYAGGTVIVIPGVEADVSPRPNGSPDNKVTIADWTQVGRFIAGLDAPANGSEFQRADCAPKDTLGDGRLTISDWVLAGRYAAGLESPAPAGGPSAPAAPATAMGDAVKVNLFVTGEDAQLQTRTLRLKEDVFQRGQQNELVVELVAQGNENALGFSLNFDLSQLSYVGAKLGNDAAGAVLNINANRLAEGRVGFGLALSSNQVFAPGVREVLKLTFAVPAGSSVNSTTISFGDLPIAREVVDPQANVLATTYSPGVIKLDPPVNLIPSLTSLEPGSVLVGGPQFTLNVNGNSFIEGAAIRVNGSARPTTFVNANQLQAIITSPDIAVPGSLEITVQNPAPGGGISNQLNLSILNPVPRLDSLSPDTVGVGSLGLTMTVNGANFVRGAVVEFNGNNRLTTYVNGSQLTAQIPTADLATAATIPVRVINPEPGGGPSNSLSFSIKPLNPLPRVTSISPSSVLAGGGAFNLTVTGTNFVNGSVVRFDGNPLPTSFVGNTQLSALVDADKIAQAGTALISVSNPAPGGGNSGGVPLTISVPPNPVPVLASISPSIVNARGQAFTLTLTGTNFVTASVARVNGQNRATTYVSPVELKATITAEDILNGGSLSIRVFNPPPEGGTSPELPLTVNFVSPRITQLSPSSVVAGSPAFTLTVIGDNFAPGSVIRWNGVDRATAYLGVGELTTPITAAEIQDVGSAQVSVFSPAPGTGLSNVVNFTINQAARPIPRIAALNPDTMMAGSPGFTLTVTGTNFVSDSVVRWNGEDRPTTFVGSTQLTASISTADIAQKGTAQVNVFTPPAGGGLSNGVAFTIAEQINPAPTLTSLNPSSVLAGGPAFTLTLNGTNFVPSSTVQINGSSQPAGYLSATQITAQVAAQQILVADMLTVRVTNPAPGGGASNSLTLTITNPTPTITALTPNTVVEGSQAFPLTVTGTGFVPGAQVLVDGVPRLATYVNSTQLTTQIAATEVAAVGALSIQVSNPAPGGGTSNALTLTIRKPNPLPRLTQISPAEVKAGGAAFLLIVEGIRFLPESVVRLNGEPRTTEFVSDTVLTTQIPAESIAAAATLLVDVLNPAPGGGTSNAATLTVINAVPRITTISPTSANAGSPDLELIVFGEGFTGNSVVRFNNVDLSTTLVSGSQLTARIPAVLLAGGGALPVTVFNPPPGGGISNAVNFTIANPTPSIVSLAPSQVVAGDAGFALTVSGSGFVPNSVVRVNGSDRLTVWVNANQLTAQVQASDIANGGTIGISVFNPAPGGGGSNVVSLQVNNPQPSLTGLTPNAVSVGSVGFPLTINGQGFVPASIVQWNGSPRVTTFIASTQLRIDVPAGDVAGAGTATIVVINPAPAGGTSNALTFTISAQPNPTPSLNGTSPASIVAGSPDFVLTVNGNSFVPGAVVQWNGSPRATTFASGTQLTAAISAADVANPGTVGLTVVNPSPGGGVSNNLSFTITPPNPVPVLTGLSPNTAAVGSPAFVMTVNGGNFVTGAVVFWNGTPRPTTFVGATQLTAAINATDLAAIGTATVAVVNPAPGGGSSNSLSFAITLQPNPVPALASLSPASALEGDPNLTLQVNGANFVAGSTVFWNGVARPTVFVSPNQLTAQVGAADLALPGSFSVTVVSPAPGGGTSNQLTFTVDPAFLNCQTVCMQSAAYYLLNLGRLPRGTVWINGTTTVIANNSLVIRRALDGGTTPHQQLTREFTAAQLNIASGGNTPGIQSSPLSCYQLSFTEVRLSNGEVLSRRMKIVDLFTQARLAISEDRQADMTSLAAILQLLNGNDPQNRCR